MNKRKWVRLESIRIEFEREIKGSPNLRNPSIRKDAAPGLT
jgi:hypothetical protein